MGIFEYLGVFISVIMGLGITHFATGATKLIQHRDDVRLYLPRALWTINTLVYILNRLWFFGALFFAWCIDVPQTLIVASEQLRPVPENIFCSTSNDKNNVVVPTPGPIRAGIGFFCLQ